MRVQLIVEFEHHQVVGGNASLEQRTGEHTGAAPKFDHATRIGRQLGHHHPGQLLSRRGDRSDPQGILQPLTEESPGRRAMGGVVGVVVHTLRIMPFRNVH
jgi:hypothetical protein